MRSVLRLLPTLAITALPATASAQAPLGTAFTYQGRLDSAGQPANGPHDLQFRLFDAATTPPGIQIGVSIAVNVTVENGLFIVLLNDAAQFGPQAFDGQARFLEIAVNGTPLTPRQPLTPAVYALAVPGFRAIPHASGPSVVGGALSNTIGPGVGAAVIGGGDSNMVNSSTGAIVGGEANTVGAISGAIGGGGNNLVTGAFGVVGGGQDNIARGVASAVLGGQNHVASGALSTIPGGDQNQAGGSFSFAAGRRAKVRDAAQVGGGDTDGDQGAFVWADSLNSDFTTTAPNQFLIRAAGGVGINTNTPQASLHVLGSVRLEGVAGAPLVLTSGPGLFGSPGGDATLATGNGASPINGNGSRGGDIAVAGGNGALPAGLGSLGGRGGDVTISGGGGSISNRGGNIALMPGAGGTGGLAGMVGIGTATPTARLDIAGVAGTDGIRFPDGSLQTKAFDGHSLDASDGSPTNALFVAANGNVGINTNTPNSKLHISGDVEITGPRLNGGSDGDVGIGTASPFDKLHVAGIARADDGFRFPDGRIQTRAANVRRGSFDFDFPSIPAGATRFVNVGPLTEIDSSSVVQVSPDLDWPDGLVIAFCHALDVDTFQVKVANITAAAIDPPEIRFEFAVFP